ncbi:apolipoprotein N-acyltransferase [Acetobacter sp. TBRC 12305]|uniref:Apolipoprotein N-acyltransferase n=2 Tax=Acetobacter garciniae TaxID=2817435 RepID=A0A939KRD4_9PROT|nr:apolipoprotein N-acyltransferase [Acetobacter garciniae]MBX0344632.1 apolipoprotein N-acyltransferase [Acetobacter garciniae]
MGRQNPREIFERYLRLTAQGVHDAQAIQNAQAMPLTGANAQAPAASPIATEQLAAAPPPTGAGTGQAAPEQRQPAPSPAQQSAASQAPAGQPSPGQPPIGQPPAGQVPPGQGGTAQMDTAGHYRPIVFLWPETSFPGYTLLQDSPRARQVIMEWANPADAGLIGALRADEDERYRNSVLALAPDGAVEAVYDKARLVPFGEYQPPFIPLQIVPQGGMAAGPGPRTWHLAGIPAVGPLICYEVIFSGEIIDRADRPRWLANVTNDGWFGDSAGPRQHLASVRLRAVEEGLPVARAANTGISAAYDGRGHRLARAGWGHAAVLVVPLPAPLAPPLFSHFGQAIPLGLSVLVGLLAGVAARRRKPA